jgi:CheY-like chemotaxis protein
MSRPPRITPITPLFLDLGGHPPRTRVLIADDQDTVRVAIASLLEKRGCEVVTAESGESALARLRSEYFDVMLCDVRMPGMSGLELLSEALLLDRDLPVLMLTGVGDTATARDALARGAMDYLTKPVELDDLDMAIRSAARHRRYEIDRQRKEQLGQQPANTEAETFELEGGPLSGQRVRLEDRRHRLWIVEKRDGEHVWAAPELPAELPTDTRLIGSYTLADDNAVMTWKPQTAG